MRAKLALLAAAAVVFAPGWGATESGGRAVTPDLAGRILAPTFEKASAGSQPEIGRWHHALEQSKPRSSSSRVVAWQSSGRSVSLFERVPIGAPVALLLVLVAFVAAARSPRAPPHLVTA